MLKLITRLLITVLALLVVSNYVPGIEVEGFYIALIVALILGFINLFIKPILLVLTLPVTLLTLGLFTFVINALLFWFVASFVQGFEVVGFIPAFLGAFIVSIFSWLGNKFLS